MQETTENTDNNGLERPLTPSEKRVIKINQLRAKLQKEQAKMNTEQRKLRDGQLIALGVLFEELYKQWDRTKRLEFATLAGKCLSGRNLDRVLGAFKRLEEEEKR